MKPVLLALTAATVASFGACTALWTYAGMPVHTLPYLYFDAELITKFADLALMLLIVGAAFMPRPRGPGGGLLTIIARLAFGFGLLAALFRGSMTLRGMQLAGTPDLRVIAPSIAEALLPLSLGLLAATVAMARVGKRPA